MTVDHSQAAKHLTKAVSAALTPGYEPGRQLSTSLKSVLIGTHITYRYILFTALLAKATNPKIDPLALQANAEIDGAYDARSLCHKVIVPCQKSLLKAALGTSNEPYLNKPARFPTLSTGNAVRRGRDKASLDALCQELPTIRSAEQAQAALTEAVHWLFVEQKQLEETVARAVSSTSTQSHNLTAFLRDLLAESNQGESLVVATAICFWLLGESRNRAWTIEVHPANEAGTSSNQIGDLDIYDKQDLVYTAELKDKTVSVADVIHAVDKAADQSASKLLLILGPAGKVEGASEETLQAESRKRGVELDIVTCKELINSSPVWADSSKSSREILKKCLEFGEMARIRPETRTHILDVAKKLAGDATDK